MQKTLTVINLCAVRNNAQHILSKLGGKKFFAVVKANAYGHGAIEVARAIEDLVQGFCVAIADEGAELRVGGITKPVLVFTPPLDEEDVQRCAFYKLTPTVTSLQTAKLIGKLPCHIKVNTGMNRYGCAINELDAIVKFLKKEQLVGVYSHMYCPQDDKCSLAQLDIFEQAAKIVKAKNGDAVAHIAASGGLLRGGKFLCDGARVGLMLYGYSPCGFVDGDLTPAMKVYARMSQSTQAIKGGVGYNKQIKSYDKLFTYRAGYADGFARGVPLGEQTLCMDAFIGERGDAVTLPQLAHEKGEWLCVFDDAEAYSQRCGTIPYEVLCSVTRRSKIIYER
jgi:alanine racemase